MRCRNTENSDLFSKGALDDDALEMVAGGAQSKYNGPYIGFWYRATCQNPSCHKIYHFMDEDIPELESVYNNRCECGGELIIENGHLLEGFQ
ncbi:MAG: hypothetical protein J5829_10160 [Lachnospiraceae bacterium]|nr:hypothetical protein [Lachnospiraceae bacterium]